MKKAIEVEYQVVDEEGRLTEPGALTDVSEYVEDEFVEPLFELKTPPCDTYADLRATFLDQLDQPLIRAEELDKTLVPSGTPIDGTSIHRLPGKRGEIQKRVIGVDFDYANYCAGTHLHFEQQNVTDQLNVLIALDPALALLNSSPYFRGKPIANGARAYLYRKKCYERFPKHGQLWNYVDSVGEWKTRLGHRLEEFKEEALRAGVDESDVDAHFSPDDVVQTPVRLREAMPTVEWRSPDTSLPSQVLRLAEETNTIMEQIPETVVRIEGDAGEVSSNGITIPEFEVVCDSYTEEAIRDGIESPAVSAYLERMGFDVGAYDPLSGQIGGHEFVDAGESRNLRLQLGERLRKDVKSLLNETPV